MPYVLATAIPDNSSFWRAPMEKGSVNIAPSGERFSTDTLPSCAHPSGLVITNTSDHAGDYRTAFSTRVLMTSPIACRFPLTSTGWRNSLKAIVRSLATAQGANNRNNTCHVGAEFDEVVTAHDLFERGRDDCQWRP